MREMKHGWLARGALEIFSFVMMTWLEMGACSWSKTGSEEGKGIIFSLMKMAFDVD